jgi:hypothetical protein
MVIGIAILCPPPHHFHWVVEFLFFGHRCELLSCNEFSFSYFRENVSENQNFREAKYTEFLQNFAYFAFREI